MLNRFMILALALPPAMAAAQQNTATAAPGVSTVLQQQLARVENDAMPMGLYCATTH